MNQYLTAGLLIPVLPLAAFVIISAFAGRYKMASALTAITAMAGSFLLALYVLSSQLAPHPAAYELSLPWMHIGDVRMDIGILINPLTSIMLIVVTSISLLVLIYSVGYMKGDESFSRFFGFISLFSFSMLGIVISNNLIQLYIFWELVGLSSYLLIGFWYQKPEASAAAKKAFVVTRFGDLGFLAGILILGFNAGTFNFLEMEAWARTAVSVGAISAVLFTAAVICLFSGAAGKSGQFPFHVWLPDAMEGPTPVSALIHAATMVAAGVFMVARLFGIFSLSPEAMMVIAYIGCFTALLAALIALTQEDIKRVLAYSTLSQLGFMMLALGAGGYTAGMFHLFTHAFFKALLFLGAGSVIHAVHTNNIWNMGGLHKKMPVTSITFLVAALAISGIFPLAGFWSKDEILTVLLDSGNKPLYYTASFTAFLTAFYMFRLYLLTFAGKPRDERAYAHAHESPAVMTVPLIILAVLSVSAGWVAIPGMEKNIGTFLYFGEHPHGAPFNMGVAVKSSVIALSGIGLALIMYLFGVLKPDAVRKAAGPLYGLSKNKFYIDEIYLFVIKAVFLRLAEIIKWFDRHVVDGAVNLSAFITRWLGVKLRLSITGRVQDYALFIFCGVIVVIAAFAVYDPEALKMFGGRQ
ncbi:MAG TPA: NADH-quinone oxidoreductase subunit L [bacterium]|nr:NADH-quinone oxidoreductase subunit L [bacterium]